MDWSRLQKSVVRNLNQYEYREITKTFIEGSVFVVLLEVLLIWSLVAR